MPLSFGAEIRAVSPCFSFRLMAALASIWSFATASWLLQAAHVSGVAPSLHIHVAAAFDVGFKKSHVAVHSCLENVMAERHEREQNFSSEDEYSSDSQLHFLLPPWVFMIANATATRPTQVQDARMRCSLLDESTARDDESVPAAGVSRNYRVTQAQELSLLTWHSLSGSRQSERHSTRQIR